MSDTPTAIFAIWYAKGSHFEHGGTWEHPGGIYTTTDREAAEYHLNKLKADGWYSKFHPQLVEYNLKENK